MINFKQVIGIGVVLSSALILTACYHNKGTNQTSTTGQQSQSQSQETVGGNVITYSDSGFLPSSIKVKVGGKVEFKNSSNSKIQVNSVPHPTHTSFPELNIGVIAAGEMKSTTFAKAGTYTYHNHLSPAQTGAIVVE